MLLQWNKTNAKYIPLIQVSDEAKAVTLTRTSVTFLPGVNEISNEEWLVVKDHVKDVLSTGSLEVLKERTHTSPGQKAEEATSIVKVPAKRAVELINNTFSPETLRLWLETETRGEVRLKITKRIETLKLNVEDDDTIKDE